VVSGRIIADALSEEVRMDVRLALLALTEDRDWTANDPY
jgi:hypothetical protein